LSVSDMSLSLLYLRHLSWHITLGLRGGERLSEERAQPFDVP